MLTVALSVAVMMVVKKSSLVGGGWSLSAFSPKAASSHRIEMSAYAISTLIVASLDRLHQRDRGAADASRRVSRLM